MWIISDDAKVCAPPAKVVLSVTVIGQNSLWRPARFLFAQNSLGAYSQQTREISPLRPIKPQNTHPLLGLVQQLSKML